MDRNKIQESIIQTLREVQQMSGRAVGKLEFSTKPIGDLQEFDSLNGVEATVLLSRMLGQEIPDENIFVSRDGSRALSIAEIADNLHVAIR